MTESLSRAPIRDRTLILRILVPGLEARLRDKTKELEEHSIMISPSLSLPPQSQPHSQSSPPFEKDSQKPLPQQHHLPATAVLGDLEGVMCEPTAARNRTLWNFHCDGATYPATLVNLPCPVELLKTHDHAMYYKSVDVAQMLIVYEDEMALEEAEEKDVEGFPSYHHSGITPPMKKVVERRFALREHKAAAPPRAAIVAVETELTQLMEKLAKDDKSKRKLKVPSLTSATKVLEEMEEEVVDYEPWMDDYGRSPFGVEFESDDQLCSLHPEVWLKADLVQSIREEAERQRQEMEAAVAMKNAKKESKKKKAKEKQEQQRIEGAMASTTSIKKGIPNKKSRGIIDEVTEAAESLLNSADFDLEADGAFLEDLDLEGENFDDLGFDL